MALVNCSECKNQVSDRAKACPKCGNPIESVDCISESLAVERVRKEKNKKAMKIYDITKQQLIVVWSAFLFISFLAYSTEINFYGWGWVFFVMLVIFTISWGKYQNNEARFPIQKRKSILAFFEKIQLVYWSGLAIFFIIIGVMLLFVPMGWTVSVFIVFPATGIYFYLLHRHFFKKNIKNRTN